MTNYEKIKSETKFATTTAISIVAILSLMVVSQSAIFPHNALATKEKSTVNDNATTVPNKLMNKSIITTKITKIVTKMRTIKNKKTKIMEKISPMIPKPE